MPGPKIVRNKNPAGEGNRLWHAPEVAGNIDPFNKAELRQFVTEPLDMCQSESDFRDLADWCCDLNCIEFLYARVIDRRITYWQRVLEAFYCCGSEMLELSGLGEGAKKWRPPL